MAHRNKGGDAMSMKQLGPIECVCDSPPYPIVQACSLIDLKRPEDVRWLRVSNYLELMGGSFWSGFLVSRGREGACTCGQPLPFLDKYQFFFASGSRIYYFLGQCQGCGTIYWDQPG